MTIAANDGPASARIEPPSGGFVWLVVGAAAATIIFWSGFISLGEAWTRPEYSHGPVIPVLSLYLFLRDLREVPPPTGQVTDRWPGFAVVLIALAIGLFGSLVRIPDLVTYGFILWIAGIILIGFGAQRGILFWSGVLHLVFMLPLPQFVYWPVSIWLQLVSSQIGVEMIRLLGVPVFLEGNVIDLGSYKLQVAEACSGLRYLFPIMSFSYVFGMLYQGPRWHKVVLLLAAAPITVLMNSFRIAVIGVLVDRFGTDQAEGFLHAFEGWVIFLACIGILFLLASLLQRTTPNPRPLAATLEFGATGLGSQAARVFRVPTSGPLVAACLVMVTAATAMHLAPAREAVSPPRAPLVLFPSDIGEWSGRTLRLDPEIERVLRADDYHSATYHSPNEAAPADLFIAWYRRQTDGSGIHSPDVCIPAAGWEVSEWRSVTVEVPVRSRRQTIPVVANRAVIQKGLERQLVYYWFEQRGRRVSSDYVAKALTLWDATMSGRTDGALVRLITPIRADEDESEAEMRLRRFMSATLEVLPDFVPD